MKTSIFEKLSKLLVVLAHPFIRYPILLLMGLRLFGVFLNNMMGLYGPQHRAYEAFAYMSNEWYCIPAWTGAFLVLIAPMLVNLHYEYEHKRFLNSFGN